MMFNKAMTNLSLPKLLDEIVLPVVLLITARFFGFFLVGLIWPFQFSFGLKSDLLSLPLIRVEQAGDLFAANSVSWALVGIILVFVFGFVLFRSYHFHQDRLHPKEATWIHNKRLEFLIIEEGDFFHQSISWLFLIIISVGFAAIDFTVGALSPVVFGFLVGGSFALLSVFWQGIFKGKLVKAQKSRE